MDNYRMLFEEITLAPWENRLRRGDPLRLGDADTFSLLRNELDDKYGRDAKLSLLTSVKKVIADNVNNSKIEEQLDPIVEEIWNATTLNDICNILDKLKPIYTGIGFILTY